MSLIIMLKVITTTITVIENYFKYMRIMTQWQHISYVFSNGIAVHYKRGGFTAWETFSTGLTLQPNHVIGCGYTKSDDNKGTVYFTHNGQRLHGCLNDVSAGLWPVVHLQRKVSLKVTLYAGICLVRFVMRF